MAAELLIKIAKKKFREPREEVVRFVDDDVVNALLSDLDKHPYVFVLCCIMDCQIKAERAWRIPYEVGMEIGSFAFEDFRKIRLSRLQRIFKKRKLDRFNDDMAGYFRQALTRIHADYGGDASMIWTGRPASSAVVYRFLQFNGVGIKIATMAANILARKFKVPFADYYSIDISPDVQVIRVMKRMGLVPPDANLDMVIYKARELYPQYPGLIDNSCWHIGREWCRPRNPQCEECIVQSECAQVI